MLGQWSLATSRTMEDLRKIMNDSLSWKEHIELRTLKANNFFHQIKRNTSYLLTDTAKLNLYKSTLILIIFFGSNCYMASKSDTRLLEKSQYKVLEWILPNLNFCERLRCLNLFPLSCYIVLTDLLVLLKLVKYFYAFSISEHINFARRRSSIRFVLPGIKIIQRSSFFYRTTYRAKSWIQILISFNHSDSKIES